MSGQLLLINYQRKYVLAKREAVQLLYLAPPYGLSVHLHQNSVANVIISECDGNTATLRTSINCLNAHSLSRSAKKEEILSYYFSDEVTRMLSERCFNIMSSSIKFERIDAYSKTFRENGL